MTLCSNFRVFAYFLKYSSTYPYLIPYTLSFCPKKKAAVFGHSDLLMSSDGQPDGLA